MSKEKNAVWRFFASVKFALVILLLLATCSIIGTLIKQGQDPAVYVQEYGPDLARLFETLEFTNMYSSWWFVTLLSLFAANLTVCSIERLPRVWKAMTADNLGVSPRQLESMGLTHSAESSLTAAAAAERLQESMRQAGWSVTGRQDEKDSSLLFAQKCAWSRLGVYIVHLSILIILIGVMIGSLFGYQAYVFLPEGKTTKHIFLRETRQPAPLDFELRCDRFDMTYYPNGMVKQYRSALTVLDPKQDKTYSKEIVVNDPLSYNGLTFFQGDAYPMEEYLILLKDRVTGQEQAFRVPAEQDVVWQGIDISFRIAELQRDQEGAVQQAKILVNNGDGDSSSIWLQHKGSATIELAGAGLTVSFRQLYSTLLLITHDPGVAIVYLGCILMLAGFIVCFMLSHRRVWVCITPKSKQGCRILCCGTTNKNKPSFEPQFHGLTERIDHMLSMVPDRPED